MPPADLGARRLGLRFDKWPRFHGNRVFGRDRTATSVLRRLIWTCGQKMQAMAGSSEYLTGTSSGMLKS